MTTTQPGAGEGIEGYQGNAAESAAHLALELAEARERIKALEAERSAAFNLGDEYVRACTELQLLRESVLRVAGDMRRVFNSDAPVDFDSFADALERAARPQEPK